MSEPCIQILMACFNGEKFVAEQIDSILQQTYANWHLTIRDDGSTDNTRAILETYRQQHPQKISLLTDNTGNAGSLLNFSILLHHAAGQDYIMFCDQDDKWLPNKIALTFSAMKQREQEHGKQFPVLIYTNFQYVDEASKIIEARRDFDINRLPSFGFAQLLAQNPVYGCTCMLNKALAAKTGVIPPEGYFHDYWIALIASAFGELHYLPQKTVLYRQHGSNVSGNFDNDSFAKRFQRIIINKKNVAETKARYAMLLCFKKKYGVELDQNNRRILDNFLCFVSTKKTLCLLRSIRNKVRSQTILQTLLMYATALFTKVSTQT